MKNVLQNGNSFNLKGIMNVATGAILGKDEKVFLMNCSSLGKAARNELYESTITYSCWKPFLKLRKAPRKRVREKNMIWLKKQFLHHLDYAHLRDFDLRILMGYEILPTFFLSYRKKFDPKAK